GFAKKILSGCRGTRSEADRTEASRGSIMLVLPHRCAMRTPLAAFISWGSAAKMETNASAPLDRFISRRCARGLSMVYELGRGASPARASVEFSPPHWGTAAVLGQSP